MTRWLFTGKQFAFSLTCGLLLLATLASPANAAIQFQIAGSGNGFTTIGSGYGFETNESNGMLLDVTFDFDALSVNNRMFPLNTGESFSFKFGTITMFEENSMGGLNNNEKDNLNVTATLVFYAPPSGNVNSPAMVTAIEGSVSDEDTDLTLSFNPVEVNFGNGGKFSVSFNTIELSKRETGLDLNATVTLLNEPVAESAVPEPASFITWGALGVVGLVLRRRRRHLRSSESQTS